MPEARTTTPPPAPPVAAATVAPKPQFSMRTLLVVVTVVAVVAALSPYRGLFNAVAALAVVVLWSVLPVMIGTLALYCRGHRQTLFLGAFAGSLAALLLHDTFLRMGGWEEYLIAVFVVMFTTSASCAYAAVATRRFLERRGWHRPADGNDQGSRF